MWSRSPGLRPGGPVFPTTLALPLFDGRAECDPVTDIWRYLKGIATGSEPVDAVMLREVSLPRPPLPRSATAFSLCPKRGKGMECMRGTRFAEILPSTEGGDRRGGRGARPPHGGRVGRSPLGGGVLLVRSPRLEQRGRARKGPLRCLEEANANLRRQEVAVEGRAPRPELLRGAKPHSREVARDRVWDKPLCRLLTAVSGLRAVAAPPCRAATVALKPETATQPSQLPVSFQVNGPRRR